jgi:hypothetical protein
VLVKSPGCAPSQPARFSPGPIRQRLASRATVLEKIAKRHARSRITLGDDDARLNSGVPATESRAAPGTASWSC